MKYPTLLLAAMAFTAIPAVLIAQGFHRNLPIGHVAVSSCQASSDDGLFIHFEQHPDKPLAKLNSAGEIVWAKSMPSMSQYVSDQEGGLLVIRPSDGIQQNGEEDPYDSFLLQRLNADGEMILNQRIKVDTWYGESLEVLEDIAWTGDGQLFLTLRIDVGQFRFMKFNEDLELVWTREAWVSNMGQYHLTALPDGGVLLHQYSDGPPYLAEITRLGPNGNEVWHRSLDVSGTVLVPDGASMVVDDEGSVLLAYTTTSGPFPNYTPWVVVAKMDVNANMVWHQAYRRAPGDQVSTFYQGNGGNSPARILPNGNIFFGTEKGFEFTPQGLFVRERICSSPTLATGFDNIAHNFTTLPTADGWMQYGMRRWTAPTFGNFVEMPLLGRTPLDLDSTCFWSCTERTDIVSEPPPPEIMIPVTGSINAISRTSISEDWQLETFIDVTMDLLEDACELPEIVEFSTSVAALDPIAPLLVYPNPSVAGQSIQVSASGPLVLEVIDAHGRIVVSNLYHFGSSVIATSGWEAGLYLLRATLPDGQVVHTTRVVVQ